MPAFTHTDWPARLWIARHGQSAGNVARDTAEAAGLALINLTTRDADTPLSSLGQQQAAAMGAWFAAMPEDERPNVVFTSPFVRSQQTAAAAIAALGLELSELRVDERLREKEFGILDRYTKHGIVTHFPELAQQRALVGKFYFRPPGGESWCDVILRLRSVLEVLRRDHVADRVLIVAHQVIVNCFRYLLEHLDEATILDIDSKADVPNCSLTEYALEDITQTSACFRLIAANQVAPMETQQAPVTAAPDKPAGPK
jgi:broad specificity phosphatase PhoE